MITASRRTLITGFVAIVAAPAIVKVASLMPVNAGLQSGGVSMRLLASYEPGEAAAQLDVLYGHLTINQITRDAVRLFRNSNEFLCNMDQQYDEAFARGEVDFVVSDGPSLSVQEPVEPARWGLVPGLLKGQRLKFETVPPIPVAVAPLALAVAALVAAPEILKTPVTRRFWAK